MNEWLFSKAKWEICSYTNDSLRIDMTLHFRIWSWFRVDQSLFLLLYAIYRRFEFYSDQTKDYKTDICCFVDKHTCIKPI